MVSCARGQAALVEQLLAAGADVDLKAKNGWNARDFAVCQKHDDVCRTLDAFA
jgi:ankyrin repeat protein